MTFYRKVEDLTDLKLYRGQVSTIVEEYKPGVFKVEFSDTKGCTYALETMKAAFFPSLS